MTLAQFVADVQAGRVLAGAGGFDGDECVDNVAPLDADDVDAVTAEAYAHDVVGPETPWDETRAEVGRLLGEAA